MKPLDLSVDKCAQSVPYSFRGLMDTPPPQVIHEAPLKVFLGPGEGVSRAAWEAVGKMLQEAHRAAPQQSGVKWGD